MLVAQSFLNDLTSFRREAELMAELLPLKLYLFTLTLLHSERPKLYTILAFLSARGLNYHHLNLIHVSVSI